MISIILPTLNEATILESTLSDLLRRQGNIEIIVADGGSSDATLDIISRFPMIKPVTSARGRGRQMNAGAKAARGDILLFLHADTRLPPRAFEMIEETMADDSVSGGCFPLRFDDGHPILNVYGLFSRINHIFFTYGDQGLFLSAVTFFTLQGFRDIPIMEDVEIQQRLRRIGRFVKMPEPVVTSSRRFQNYGALRQQIANTALVFLYHLGVSPALLKRYYPYD